MAEQLALTLISLGTERREEELWKLLNAGFDEVSMIINAIQGKRCVGDTCPNCASKELHDKVKKLCKSCIELFNDHQCYCKECRRILILMYPG